MQFNNSVFKECGEQTSERWKFCFRKQNFEFCWRWTSNAWIKWRGRRKCRRWKRRNRPALNSTRWQTNALIIHEVSSRSTFIVSQSPAQQRKRTQRDALGTNESSVSSVAVFAVCSEDWDGGTNSLRSEALWCIHPSRCFYIPGYSIYILSIFNK